MKIKRRNTREVVEDRDLKIVYDYKNGMPIKEIMSKHGLGSHQTVYNAIRRVESRNLTEDINNA